MSRSIPQPTMSPAERDRYYHGGPLDRAATVKSIAEGAFGCDSCDSAAVTIGHSGSRASLRVECRDHFLSSLQRARETRPSRAELIAHVNASAGIV